MTWKIGDQGFEMTLSPKVGGLIGEHLRPWLEGWLDSRGLALGDVATWAIHPGGPKILDAAEAALGLPRSATDDSREVLAAYGNMSSPTVLFLLDRLRAPTGPAALRRAGLRPRPGDRGGAVRHERGRP